MNRPGLKKLYKSYYEKICALESKTAINAFACGFCKRSLHVTASPAIDKNPSGKWVMCRRCLGIPYCTEAHREAHRPVHEFSCAIHPGWMPPGKQESRILRCATKFLQEPEMDMDILKTEFGAETAKNFKDCRDMMIKSAMYFDTGSIKHAADCECLGCLMRRGGPAPQQKSEAGDDSKQEKSAAGDLLTRIQNNADILEKIPRYRSGNRETVGG